MTLNLQNLTKKYGKSKFGLRDFSLSVENGILGLLGPNGAGKSTLLQMIATISKPSKGVVLLNKNNIVKDPNYMRKQLGYLPQDFGTYPNLSAMEFLKYIAALKGVDFKSVKPRVNYLLEQVNLMHAANKPIKSFSGGMRQRVGIAQALINNPKVIIFDEPTVGLDPEERIRFRNLISGLATDSIIILSSHIVSDIEHIADDIVVMNKGELVTTGNANHLISKVKGQVFETIIEVSDLENFKKENVIIDIKRVDRNLSIRHLSGNPKPTSKLVEPKLEDAYLSVITKNA